MGAKMALMEILKKYSFVQAPETEVSGHCFGLSLSSQTISRPLGTADVIRGVSNRWTGIWNRTMEWKMEWNSEHTQLQLTRVTGAAQSRLNYLVAVISPQKLYEQLRHCPLSCFYILAWYHCWLIIRCSVIAVLQSQTLERKTRVQLCKIIV